MSAVGPTTSVYGMLTLAGMDVALPMSALREVVPRPAAFTELPVAAPGLLGAMSLRRLVLPVVDVRPLIGRPADSRAEQVVVVVAQGGQALGLLADAVGGVTEIASDELLAMSASGGDLLFSHTALHPDSDLPFSVLDAAALLHLPGIPTVADRGHADTTRAGAHRRGTGRSLTIVRCGEQLLALDVAQVHTTLPLVEVRSSVLSGGMCRGVTSQAGQEVPVVDPLVLLGMPALDAADARAGVVLDFGHGQVVLAVTELVELVEVAPDDVLPVPRHAAARPDLTAGVLDLPGRPFCLVLDGPALLADPELSGLASVTTSLAGAGVPDDPSGLLEVAAARGGPVYLTYGVGADVATPLEQVAEILPFPTRLTDAAAGGATLGVVVHRRCAVPVLWLPGLLGRDEPVVADSACLLLVEVDGEHIAFAVPVLRAILPLTWADPDTERGRPIPDLRRALRTPPLVQVGVDGRLVPDLDLHEVTRTVRAASGVPALAG